MKKYSGVVNLFFSVKEFKLYSDWLDMTYLNWQIQKYNLTKNNYDDNFLKNIKTTTY